ncbi:MAG: EamA family transporter, partial [Usitatibacter sp.]
GDAAQSMAIWAGVLAAGLAHVAASPTGAGAALRITAANAGLVAVIAASLVAMGLALQYGLSRTPANRAIVILLFELVVAAIAAHYLAGETMRAQDWLGGSLIVAASLAGGWMERRR